MGMIFDTNHTIMKNLYQSPEGDNVKVVNNTKICNIYKYFGSCPEPASPFNTEPSFKALLIIYTKSVECGLNTNV